MVPFVKPSSYWGTRVVPFRLWRLQGVDCEFCHLCDAGEKKRRAKQRAVLRKGVGRFQDEGKLWKTVVDLWKTVVNCGKLLVNLW